MSRGRGDIKKDVACIGLVVEVGTTVQEIRLYYEKDDRSFGDFGDLLDRAAGKTWIGGFTDKELRHRSAIKWSHIVQVVDETGTVS